MNIGDLNVLKYIQQFVSLNRESEGEYRFSLLDAYLLLLIFENADCIKQDLVEWYTGDRQGTKSSLDRPLLRLQQYGLIDKTVGKHTTSFRVSKKGKAFLRKSQ